MAFFVYEVNSMMPVDDLKNASRGETVICTK
jgi:hypothetical protein